MKTATILITLAVLLLAGCTSPINTVVKVDGIGTYKSERNLDLTYTTWDPAPGEKTKEITVSAHASDPAASQAERDKVQAETMSKAMDIVNESLKALPKP